MLLRIFTEPQQGASYDDLLRMARATEDLGFDAFFRSDHYLAMGGDGLPGPTDAWLTLAGLARETSRVRLGTLVTSATFRLPGPLAVAVAQVDAMSGGRVELGLGAGWFVSEHQAYGIPFPSTGERFARLAEQLEVVDGLWRADGPYSFAGQHYQLTDSPGLPKPVQRPRPPIIVGGSGPKRTPALAARFADEFNAPFPAEGDLGALFGRVREAVAVAGRTAESISYSVALTVAVGATEADRARRATALGRDPDTLPDEGLSGSPAQVVDKLGRLRELGADRVYLQLPDASDPDVVDHLELIAAQVLPQV